MFQHFYLISLLLCIKLVFSYEYLDDPERPLRYFGKNVREVNTAGRRKDRRNSIRQEYGYDKSPVEFDVAGFIQPDEETIAENEEVRRRNQRRRRTKNNDYSSVYGTAAEEGNTRDANHDYLAMGDSEANLKPSLIDLGPPLLKDSLNIKKFKMNSLDEANARYANENFKNQIVLKDPDLAHNPQKKCVLKNFKLPFFSRTNKTDSLKQKNAKKRKLFCFNCTNKRSEGKRKQGDSQIDTIHDDKKGKRSYEENLCPACKQKFISFESKDKVQSPWNRPMHNRLISERYIEEKVKDNLKVDPDQFYYSDENGTKLDNTQRDKREEPGILMNRELDMIQQMIEHEDVRAPPSSTKPTSPPPDR